MGTSNNDEHELVATGTGFSETMRAQRIKAGKRLKDVANALDFSVTYMSELERGTRAPFASRHIIAFSNYLGLSKSQTDRLMYLAAVARHEFVLNTYEASETKLKLGAALMLSWSDLTDTQCDDVLMTLLNTHATKRHDPNAP